MQRWDTWNKLVRLLTFLRLQETCLYCVIGRAKDKIAVAEAYLKAAKLFRNYNDAAQDPVFTKVNN